MGEKHICLFFLKENEQEKQKRMMMVMDDGCFRIPLAYSHHNSYMLIGDGMVFPCAYTSPQVRMMIPHSSRGDPQEEGIQNPARKSLRSAEPPHFYSEPVEESLNSYQNLAVVCQWGRPRTRVVVLVLPFKTSCQGHPQKRARLQ